MAWSFLHIYLSSYLFLFYASNMHTNAGKSNVVVSVLLVLVCFFFTPGKVEGVLSIQYFMTVVVRLVNHLSCKSIHDIHTQLLQYSKDTHVGLRMTRVSISANLKNKMRGDHL